MKASRLYIGAFALIVCAIAAFAVTSAEPADAAPVDVDNFAAGINSYSEAVLGTDKVVKAEVENNVLKITVDTSAIDSMSIDLRGILTEKFTAAFAGMTVLTTDDTSADITIIDAGKPTNNLDEFAARVISGLKATYTSDTPEYNGEVNVNGTGYKAMKVVFVMTNESREVAEVLSSMTGGAGSIIINCQITDGVFKAFGISYDDILKTTVSDVFKAFANGKGASSFFSSSAAKYFDVLCNKINTAVGLADILKNNIQIPGKTIDSVEISGKYGFKGLMETLSTATVDFGVIGDITHHEYRAWFYYDTDINLRTGPDGETELDTIEFRMYVIYSYEPITVEVKTSEGGTATLNGDNSVTEYAGTPFTVTATPDSGYTIASIEYYVGDKKVDSLGTSDRTNTFIHFGGLAHFVVVTFSGDAPAPPTPVPPAPDDPDEPEDLPDDGTVINPDGSTTTTVTDEDTGIKSSVTEKDGKVTKVVSETESGTKYSSVGEGSTVTTTVWSSDLNGFMVDALTEQAALITGGKTADLVIVSTEVNISADVAGDIAAAFETVTLTNEDARMEIPANVVKNLAKDGKLKITSKQATSSDMTDKQRSVVGNNYVLKFTATAGTTAVHELGDNVTIGFYYTPTTSLSGKHVVVKYVDDDGKTTDMQTTYANGRVTFVTDHFSVYFVDIVEDAPGGGGSSSGNNNILYIAVAAAAVAAIAVCIAAMVYFKKD